MSGKEKKKAVSKGKCPYCADPNLFDKVLMPPVGTPYTSHPSPGILRFGSHWPKVRKAKRVKLPPNVIHDGTGSPFAIDQTKVVLLKSPEIVHGKYHIKTVTDEDMIPRYAGFKVQIIGVESRTEPPSPSGPFLSRAWTEGDKGKYNFVSFNAARITHKDSTIIIDVHWSPEHGRVMTVHGFTTHQTKLADLAIINRAFEFYKQETRGGPKISEDAIAAALQSIGPEATQGQVANELKVTESGIERWRMRRRMTWREVKIRYGEGV